MLLQRIMVEGVKSSLPSVQIRGKRTGRRVSAAACPDRSFPLQSNTENVGESVVA